MRENNLAVIFNIHLNPVREVALCVCQDLSGRI